MSENTPKHHHAGHRARLIAKLETGSLCEHEYLEALLFNAIPRRNTNDLAHKLLAKFGSVRGVFSAPMDALAQVEGIGASTAAYIYTVRKLMECMPQEKEIVFPREYDPEFFCGFVKQAYVSLSFETLELYLLDSSGGVYKRKSFSTEELLRVTLDAELLNEYITTEKPSGMVLVHTHPKGDMRPSHMDDYTTQFLRNIARANNVLFCDHIIYSPEGIYSYRLAGRINVNATHKEF